MHGDPLMIRVKDGAVPKVSHSPIKVPAHWRAKVKAQLDRYERLGVIEKVPTGTYTMWCHRMVIVPKKDGTPRRTVNFQPLNEHTYSQKTLTLKLRLGKSYKGHPLCTLLSTLKLAVYSATAGNIPKPQSKHS